MGSLLQNLGVAPEQLAEPDLKRCTLHPDPKPDPAPTVPSPTHPDLDRKANTETVDSGRCGMHSVAKAVSVCVSGIIHMCVCV